jgi:hypothetical protein
MKAFMEQNGNILQRVVFFEIQVDGCRGERDVKSLCNARCEIHRSGDGFILFPIAVSIQYKRHRRSVRLKAQEKTIPAAGAFQNFSKPYCRFSIFVRVDDIRRGPAGIFLKRR